MNTLVKVWDLPTRIFHWLLALSFFGAYVTSESERFRDVHVFLGYAVVALITFRLVWGVVGPYYARFSSFAFGPARVIRYLKSLLSRSPEHYVGHNPAGSWVIYMLLILGLLSGASGYLVYNDIGGDWLEELHEGASGLMLTVVGVHVLGVIASSLLHKENLVRAMITGSKQGDSSHRPHLAHSLFGIVLLAGMGMLWSVIL